MEKKALTNLAAAKQNLIVLLQAPTWVAFQQHMSLSHISHKAQKKTFLPDRFNSAKNMINGEDCHIDRQHVMMTVEPEDALVLL